MARLGNLAKMIWCHTVVIPGESGNLVSFEVLDSGSRLLPSLAGMTFNLLREFR